MRMVITGPESSGKSTLCRDLSQFYKGRMIPEYARKYLESLGLFEYEYEDVIYIAQQQYLSSQNSNEYSIQFEDTDLLNIIVWMEMKFNKIDTDIFGLFEVNLADYYLICLPDLKWEYDPLRESPLELDLIFKRHLFYLQKYHLNYRIVSGYGRQRLNNAIFHVQDMLNGCNFAV